MLVERECGETQVVQLMTKNLFLMILLVLAGASHAKPFTPTSDEQVLQRLPYTAAHSEVRELRQFRVELERQPDNLRLAAKLAWRFIRLGRNQTDPRYYGYAESALQPWWKQSDPPVPVLLLRATIRQNRHDFAGALRDLTRLLALQPNNTQAWLTQAVVQTVIGQYEPALASCRFLSRSASSLIRSACMNNVLSLSGQAERAYEQIANALASAATAPVAERLWALTTLAEIAVRLGWNQRADRHFRTALALDRSDVYLLSAYADFLLDQDQPQAVRDLLQGQIRIDALLLRLALAEQRLQGKQAETYREELQLRIQAIRQRGINSHLGAASRLALELQGQPETALALALDNWRQQHEPRDARLVLETALAARQPQVAKPVLAWLEATGLEDVRLTALVAQLEEQVQ